MQKLSGKTAVFTGGSSSIGLATATLFAEHGARVLLVGRDEEHLLRVQREVPGASVLRADCARLDDLARLADTAGALFGSVDVLFLDAGEAQITPFEQVTEEQFDASVTRNFKGVFFTIQRLLPALGPGASVIVTTSVAHTLDTPESSADSACEAALSSLVQSLAPALIARGIRINAISPGSIDIPRLNKVGALPELRAPTGRSGEPTAVARVALFLACDDSSCIVGEVLVVDRGLGTEPGPE